MFKNYLKITLRNLWKNKGYSVLNIFGLAIGIACAGLIFLWMEDELSFDNTYAKKDLLYMIRTNQTYEGKVRTFNSTPGGLAPAIATEIPGIAKTCRFGYGGSPLFSLGEKSINEKGMYVDSSAFDMFAFSFLQGNAKDAFKQLNAVVISQKLANQFFTANENVIGKTIKIDNKQDYLISGVISDLPANSTFQFDWFASFEVFAKKNDWLQYWRANGVNTYVELQPNADVAKIRQQLDTFIVHKVAGQDAARPILFAMSDWHLRDQFEDGKQLAGGRITYVRLFSVIAWIILLIACINFMNLATARSEKRSREVGVRKVMGAARGMLILQFIGEAICMSVLAVLIGIAIMAMVLPVFNLLVEKNLGLGLRQPLHWMAIAAIAIVCGLVAGSYPALYLSSFNPVFVLKGTKSATGSASLIRKSLVVLQFTVSIVLIIATIITYQQVQHIKNRNLGYNKENLVQADVQGDMVSSFSLIKQDLLNTGFVENVALSDNQILYTSNNTTGYSWEGKDESKGILISFRSVSNEFMKTWGMQIKEGRDFRETGDSSNVIITESFAKLIGKESAIGKIIRDDDKKLTVVGVIKDLVYGDMYGQGDPAIFFCDPKRAENMYIRLKPTVKTEDAVTAISAIMKKDNPAYPFKYEFVDAQFNALFKTETLTGELSRIFAILAILISCLGLFGLAAYMAERRTREIGIRKVLGASSAGMAGLLSKSFINLVLISALLAFPVAWYMMHEWLNGFNYRITISSWVFVISGIMALIIALATISFQAIRIAAANPVKSLRSE